MSGLSGDMSALPKVKPMTYNDAYELITRKILINKMSIENLKMQIEFSQCDRKLQELSIDVANKKIELANRLTELFEQQLTEFTADRQDQCIYIYQELNQLDKPSVEYVSLCKKLDSLNEKMKDLCVRIDGLERTIPKEKLLTQFLVKQSTADDCHTSATILD
jgi:recombinational DNA repair ATPase RecF